MSSPNSDEAIYQLVTDVAQGRSDPGSNANQLAQAVESKPRNKLEDTLFGLWRDVIALVKSSQNGQGAVVQLLLALTRQPDVKDGQGSSVEIYGAALWHDLPMFGWEINGIWENREIPNSEPARSQAITQYVNAVHFTALLIATGATLFQQYRLQILWSFRALESPTADENSEAFKELDVNLPAIAAIVDVLGNTVKGWEDEYPSGENRGAPGSGGPLWNGKQGFSVERYGLWKKRLEEIGGQENVDQSLRSVAARTAAKM